MIGKIIILKCPKCGTEYKMNEYHIDYQFYCDDCDICLYPEDTLQEYINEQKKDPD